MEDFTDAQVDLAIEYVITNGAEDRAQTISYTRVFGAADMPAPQELHLGGESHRVTEFMARFHFRCQERGLPPLDALVVHIAGPFQGRPGGGYFKVNGHVNPFGNDRATPEQQTAAGRFWEEQVRQCREWGERSRRERSSTRRIGT